jgi:hypothetical protein
MKISPTQFWQDVSRFQRALYPDVTLFFTTQKGTLKSDWPSFYVNQLANSRNDPRRKRADVTFSGKKHVALFIKNVRYDGFKKVVQPHVGNIIQLAPPAAAWQSVRISVPEVDPTEQLEAQTTALDHVFVAARTLYHFFLQNEASLLGLRTAQV